MNQNRIERLPRARPSFAKVLISMQKGEFLSISRYIFKVYSKNHRVIISKPENHRGNFPAVASDCDSFWWLSSEEYCRKLQSFS
jgi:hypothetical protein